MLTHRFISLANERHDEIEETQKAVTKTLETIRQENEMAIRLKKQLDHEMVVLEERKAVRVLFSFHGQIIWLAGQLLE